MGGELHALCRATRGMDDLGIETVLFPSRGAQLLVFLLKSGTRRKDMEGGRPVPEPRFPGPALTEAQGARRHWCLGLSEALLSF